MVVVVVIVGDRQRSGEPVVLAVVVIRGGGGGSGRKVVEVEVERERRREVSLSFDTTEETGGAVVSESSFFGSVESAKPNPSFLPRISNLCRVTAPRSLPYSPVVHLPRACSRRRHSQESQEIPERGNERI